MTLVENRMFNLVNKKFIFLFFLTLFIFKRDVFSSVISKRATIKLNKPGVINCERVDELIVECESSSVIMNLKPLLLKIERYSSQRNC